MRYVVEIQDFVANAFIESSEKRFLSYREVEEYGANAVRKLNENGKNAILSFSGDTTKAFLIAYSEFFADAKEGRDYGIALKDGVTVESLVEKFRDIIPLELLRDFASAEVLDKFAEPAAAGVYDNMINYIADHNEHPVDFIHALHNVTGRDFDDETILNYLREFFGDYCSDQMLSDAVVRYREEQV